jgi:hypothetical protein
MIRVIGFFRQRFASKALMIRSNSSSVGRRSRPWLFAVQAKMLQSQAAHFDGRDPGLDLVDGGGVGEDQLDPTNIHADRHGAGAASGSLTPKVDDELPIDLGVTRVAYSSA